MDDEKLSSFIFPSSLEIVLTLIITTLRAKASTFRQYKAP